MADYQKLLSARSVCAACVILALATTVTAATPATPATPASTAQPEVLVANGNFEASSPHGGWTLYTFGDQPTIIQDSSVRRSGRYSLRIAASGYSDTALGQEVHLRPGKLYRLSGWVRTRNLQIADAGVYGTLRVATHDGRTAIAQCRNNDGNTQWKRETVIFRAPDDGEVQLAIFFAGFGKAKGAVWFDDISLEELRAANALICVQNRASGSTEISPFQYGQFIEPFHDCVIGMWSEKLSDTGFEGIEPFKFAFRRETDFRERPWYPVGAVHRGSFTLDRVNPLNGSQSSRIEAEGVEPCTVGIAQSGLSVAEAQPCRLSVYLRRSDQPLRVRACLRAGGRVLAEAAFNPGRNWKKYTAQFTPSSTSDDVTFCLEFCGPGTLWVDQISLMPTDTVSGWRPDVVQAIRELKPGIIRWGGIAIENSDWRNLIGNPDQRVHWRDKFWGSIHTAAVGPEEFIALCKAVDAEPMICVRVTGSDPAEAAAQVEYFNGGANTPMGRLRAQNGHREPYGIRYWQVGNELSGAEYAASLPGFCKAMRRVDPSIKLLSSFPDADVLRQAGTYLDYICPHHYADLPGQQAGFDELRRLLAGHRRGDKIRVAVTEWNTTAGDFGLKRNALWTLDNALVCAIYHNIMHQNADLVQIANRSDMANSHCAGVIQTSPAGLFKTPAYYAQYLYANYAGSRPLLTHLEGDLPQANVSATQSADGRELVLFVVNTLTMECAATIDLTSFGWLAGEVQVWTLADTQKAGERDAGNSFDNPQRIRASASEISAESAAFEYTFPKLSLTVLRCLIK